MANLGKKKKDSIQTWNKTEFSETILKMVRINIPCTHAFGYLTLDILFGFHPKRVFIGPLFHFKDFYSSFEKLCAKLSKSS